MLKIKEKEEQSVNVCPSLYGIAPFRQNFFVLVEGLKPIFDSYNISFPEINAITLLFSEIEPHS
jgi:hypothetical protein